MPIAYLADYPHLLPVVASWIHDQWGRRSPGVSLQSTIERYRPYVQRDALPLTMVALSDEEVPLGTASLCVHGMHIRKDLTPWLAAVYVAPEHRGLGVGSAVVQATEGVAREMGFRKLYLFTPDREHFYARLGWHVLERVYYQYEWVVIMHKSLDDIGGDDR